MHLTATPRLRRTAGVMAATPRRVIAPSVATSSRFGTKYCLQDFSRFSIALGSILPRMVRCTMKVLSRPNLTTTVAGITSWGLSNRQGILLPWNSGVISSRTCAAHQRRAFPSCVSFPSSRLSSAPAERLGASRMRTPLAMPNPSLERP